MLSYQSKVFMDQTSLITLTSHACCLLMKKALVAFWSGNLPFDDIDNWFVLTIHINLTFVSMFLFNAQATKRNPSTSFSTARV